MEVPLPKDRSMAKAEAEQLGKPEAEEVAKAEVKDVANQLAKEVCNTICQDSEIGQDGMIIVCAIVFCEVYELNSFCEVVGVW